jgi:enoyl-CoA hydratase
MMDEPKKSDLAKGAMKPTNKAGLKTAAEPVERRAGTKGNVNQQSTYRTQIRDRVTQALGRVRKAAKERKKERFTALLHHVDVDLLRLSFYALKRKAAPGVDGVTWQDYEADLEKNLLDLHARVHRGAYRAQPSRRKYILKSDGRQRPLGIASVEDKILQRAVVAVLTPIYEEDFLGFSYGFRPKRSQHDTIGAVILRGAGRCFSAGHDLADLAVGERLPRPNFQAGIIERLANLPQVVISAVHGHCYTGALELALAGDIIFAAESAKFADTHAKWALTPIWGLSQRLPRRVGAYKAREMMFTCDTYSGAQALAMSLANVCVADAVFDDKLEAYARGILTNSWFSHRANKRLLIEMDGLPQEAGLAHEVFRSAGVGADMDERIAQFGKR